MNVSKLTQTYIHEHPSVADCLDRGLINYSALSREICRQHNLKAFDAVLIACRRYHKRQKDRQQQEKKIAALLRTAKVHIRNKIAVAIIEKGKGLEKALALHKHIRKQRGDFNLIEGEEFFVVVTNEEYLQLLKETFGSGIKRITKRLVQITMIFDERLETTSGVVAYLYRLFSGNNINILEEMSCWTDVMIVVDEKDTARAMQILDMPKRRED